MSEEFYKQLQNILTNQSEELIGYWLEYFDDEQKDEAYRYYDDFLGFFEECLESKLDIKSDEREAMLLFLTKLQETIGAENFFHFRDSVYSCYLKFPLFRVMDDESIFNLKNASVMTAFFEGLTSSLMIREHQKNTQ